MKKAFAYYRVSTEEQAKEGISIEAQQRIIIKWATDNDYSVNGHFTDDGKSASNLNRPALQDLITQLDEKDVDALIVLDTDRLARNTLDHLTIKAILKEHNVKLISVNQPMLDDSPEGNLVDTIIASVNAFQSQITGRKTSKVMEQKAMNGWMPGLPPLGYINSKNPNPKSKLDDKIITLDKEVSQYIKKAFEMYATGTHSFNSIAEYLNSKHVKPLRGLSVSTTTVSNLLTNKFYTGSFIWGGKEYKGKHEPLISARAFNKTQQIIESRKRANIRVRKHDFLLRGFIYSDLGIRLIGAFHKKASGKEYSFYFSDNKKHKEYVDREKIEKAVEKLFTEIQLSSAYVDHVMETAKRMLKEIQKGSDKEKSFN